MSTELLDRILGKTAAAPGGCVVWTASVNKSGYGQIRMLGRNFRVHRVVYEQLVGPIPEGLVLDHTCHNRDETCSGGVSCRHRRCLNPNHLEPVTDAENFRRSPHRYEAKVSCEAGHPFDEANTYIRKDTGTRQCRACGNERRTRDRKAAGAPTLESRREAERERRKIAEGAIIPLYASLGRRPNGREVVAALIDAEYPAATHTNAKKLRTLIEAAHPHLNPQAESHRAESAGAQRDQLGSATSAHLLTNR